MINIPNPYDGEPFYCEVCGAGYGEYLTCLMADCKLEHAAVAHERKLKRQRELKRLAEYGLSKKKQKK